VFEKLYCSGVASAPTIDKIRIIARMNNLGRCFLKLVRDILRITTAASKGHYCYLHLHGTPTATTGAVCVLDDGQRRASCIVSKLTGALV
jgi:hypothetical protein